MIIVMRRHLFYILLLGMLLAPAGIYAHEIDLNHAYRLLDEAIGQSERFVQVREQRIQRCKAALEVTTDARARYELCRRLSDEYRPYMNDSALHYIGRCITLARQLGDQAGVDECSIQLAYQCSESGMYQEAMDILNGIDASRIGDAQGRQRYYGALEHLYSELGYYCRVPDMQQRYYAKHDYYSSLIDTAGLSSDQVLQLEEMKRYAAGDAQGALRYSDMRLSRVREGARDYAIVAFYRFLDYSLLGDSVQTRYWVTQSALSDVKNAVMDQGAMWELAGLLMTDGDMDRAYRYIRFAWQCATKFNTAKRNGQISPVLTAISDNYEASLKRANRLLLALAVVASLLACLFMVILFYSNSQRKKLSRTRWRLSETNHRLAQLNSRLSDLNGSLSETNLKLNESNRVKDEYVGRFIHLCSFYIDRLDEMRRRVNKMVKGRDLDALYRFTEGSELRDKNLSELYGMFDSTFLHLFPHFVADFNALLKPECRITLPEAGVLNTDVRIFALIRLGIEDSGRIAEFLHYSVNTIYNYRAKVKNGALGDRDDFENQVKAIGM